MPYSAAQTLAIKTIRGHRSAASYFAGSTVLAETIGRIPGDLDLHHASLDTAFAARAMDLSALTEQGFALCHTTDHEEETEAVLRHSLGDVTINWVNDHSPHFDGARPHWLLGHALTIADVYLIKVITAFDFQRPKDMRDLAVLSSAGFRPPPKPEWSRVLRGHRDGTAYADQLHAFAESLPRSGMAAE